MWAARPTRRSSLPNGEEVWVTVRGENYISVLDPRTYAEKTRITVPSGPGMQIFSPDGKYAYVCSSFNPETVVITVADHQIVGRVAQVSPFCPNIAATPDGKQVWMTLKDTGKTEVFDAKPPFSVLRAIDTGPITNHVNFARINKQIFAYVTRRRLECGEGVPGIRWRPGRNGSGRQVAARSLAIR